MEKGIELSEVQTHTLTLTGAALLTIQTTEKALIAALQLPLHSEDYKGIEDFEVQLGTLNRLTLGKLVKGLLDRVDLHPQFESMVLSFVDFRNAFVHQVNGVMVIRSVESCLIHQEKCNEIISVGNILIEILTALLIDWMEQVEMTSHYELLAKDPHFNESIQEWRSLLHSDLIRSLK